MLSWITVLRRGAYAFKETLSGNLRESTSSPFRVLYHIALIIVSAWIALSLPRMVETFLDRLSRLEDQTEFMITSEGAIAFSLIVLLDYLWRSLSGRKLARMAKSAGLGLFPPQGISERRVQSSA
jgi:hypothetical protein